jgi:hypothetical protein
LDHEVQATLSRDYDGRFGDLVAENAGGIKATLPF